MHAYLDSPPRGGNAKWDVRDASASGASGKRERMCVCVYTHRSTGTIDRVTKEVPLRGCEVPVPAMTRKGEVVRREEIRRDRYFW